jgi:hypothetical protein
MTYYERHRRSAFLLIFLGALSSIALMAGGAQANWKVGGAELKANETIAGSAHTEGNLLVPAQKLEVLCKKKEIHGELLASAFGLHASLLISICVTFQSGKESVGCKPIEPIVAKVKGKLILHNSLSYVLFEPATAGGVLTTVEFNPAKCALAEENEITGTFVAECITSALATGAKLCEAEAATHYFKQAPEALFSSDKMKFGENPMTIDGIDKVTLSGANIGKLWSGIV